MPKADDACKLDFRTHVNGFVIDNAFTIAYNLWMALKERTNNGIKYAGIDARLREIDALEDRW